MLHSTIYRQPTKKSSTGNEKLNSNSWPSKTKPLPKQYSPMLFCLSPMGNLLLGKTPQL